jgi:hypothetical protein
VLILDGTGDDQMKRQGTGIMLGEGLVGQMEAKSPEPRGLLSMDHQI